MLQSPKFLFHARRSGAVPRRDCQPALVSSCGTRCRTRALFDAAASGELRHRRGRESSDRADARRSAGAAGAGRIHRAVAALRPVAGRGEGPRAVSAVHAGAGGRNDGGDPAADCRYCVWNDRNFMEVFTADYSVCEVGSGDALRVPAPAAEFDEGQLSGGVRDAPDCSGRRSFLATTSKPGETSPTVRGFFVREHFLCQQVPDPPPGTNTNLPPIPTVEQPQTDAPATAARTRPIATCARLPQPDGPDRLRTGKIRRDRPMAGKERSEFLPDRQARGKPTVDVDLRPADRDVAGMPNSAFSTPRELGQMLPSSRHARSASSSRCSGTPTAGARPPRTAR